MTPCYEYVVLNGASAAPGSVQRSSSGRIERLHFAPGRWLIPEPTDATLASLRSAGGVLFDVSGKWQPVALGNAAFLKRAIDVEAVLAGRECAAVTLFDCPVILTRGTEAWVHGSYADAFSRAAGLRPSLHPAPGSSPSSPR